ncbi:MAG TPA: DUF4328 domain-containing protein [Pyrinomonadaceae bacterium]|nr:DUF4328 domain-containing protein [Pyrinomonadaceae bacterium]
MSFFIFVLEFFYPQFTNSDEEITDPVTLAAALVVMGLALLEIAVYIATVVAFLMWLYRSYENLPSFGIRKGEIKYSSGWAVGSFFVPFVTLVVPYRAIKELWNKSVPNSGDFFRDLGPPGFFPLWWGFWLASNFANQIYLRLSWRGEMTPEVSSILGLVTSILDIVAAILAIMVVREIDRQQRESEKLIPSLYSNPQPPPPPVLETA